MRELTATEIFEVGGAGDLTFSSPVTLAMLNNVSSASAIFKMAVASYGLGYALGTWLNNKFDISTSLLDWLMG